MMLLVIVVAFVTFALGRALHRGTSARCVRLRLRADGGISSRTRTLMAPLIAWLRRRHGVRRAARHESSTLALAALLDDVARRCASGESMANAFLGSAHLGPLAPRFDRAISSLDRGSTMAEAMSLETADGAAQALALHVLMLCARVGGNVSESLDGAAATLRDRDAAEQERHAQSAYARLSARVLTVVPLVFAGWTVATDPRARGFMLSPAGTACLCLGLGFNLVGSRVMRRIIGGLQ